MDWIEALAIFAAGVAAGTINTLVGSGTLITFPTLLAFGYAPVTANISNNIGLVPGGISGSFGYREELRGQRGRILRLGPMSLLGSVTGAVLLLVLPAEAFATIVPVLLAISLVLVIVQPWMQRRLQERRESSGQSAPGRGHGVLVAVSTYAAGIYGGYFGAAQGVLLIGLLGILLPEPLQRLNALKNVLSLIVNAVAAVTFAALAFGRIDWAVVGLIAVGSLLGGFIGAGVGRRLPAVVLRGLIVVVGIVAIWRILAA
ncbi:MAG: sulfite exporter TauE/SafE family protein [Actinomycetota bacterium]|nr:sulfite exporter TauE/SafE family protein [Geodermatophilaceae bacterium]MDQ3504912.1 sulfite exporter TauE/SafE family protein [Actinomycetota bacterium]